MRYIDEYRDLQKTLRLAFLINSQVQEGPYRIMEVCGTHTAAIAKFGIKAMLSGKIRLISGPGCPVCVTSDTYLRNAIGLSRKPSRIIATYPDMLKVPAGHTSLEHARSKGADVRSVNSAFEALQLAQDNPGKEVVFLGVGFETTAPGTALCLKAAKRKKLSNFCVYSAHKTIPEALEALGGQKDLALDGFLLPGHVSAIIGLQAYQSVFKATGISSVISGFEPLDILLSIYKIVFSLNAKTPICENAYPRVVETQGNVKAQKLLKEVFTKTKGHWRGLGWIQDSALSIDKSFRVYDAVKRFDLKEGVRDTGVSKGCRCADVLKGKIEPGACPYFAIECAPRSPKGPCMVSREGSCRSFFEYHRPVKK